MAPSPALSARRRARVKGPEAGPGFCAASRPAASPHLPSGAARPRPRLQPRAARPWSHRGGGGARGFTAANGSPGTWRDAAVPEVTEQRECPLVTRANTAKGAITRSPPAVSATSVMRAGDLNWTRGKTRNLPPRSNPCTSAPLAPRWH